MKGDILQEHMSGNGKDMSDSCFYAYVLLYWVENESDIYRFEVDEDDMNTSDLHYHAITLLPKSCQRGGYL
jgi:hypothetical protein